MPLIEHFVPWAGANLHDILCLQEERVVRPDNCVAYHNKLLQISADRHRCHHVKATVRVHEYPNGQLAVFHGPRCLARYDAHGKQLKLPTRKGCLTSPRSLDQTGHMSCYRYRTS